MVRLWRVLDPCFVPCIMLSMIRPMQNPCVAHDFMILSVEKIIKKCKHLTFYLKFPCQIWHGIIIVSKKASYKLAFVKPP